MLSSDFLVDLAKNIQTGLEHTAERLLRQAETTDPTVPEETPLDNLSKRSEKFAMAVAEFFKAKNVSEPELAERIGCLAEDVQSLRRKSAARPSKDLVTVLCLALKLTPDEAKELFRAADYELVDYEVFDIVLAYCLEKGVATLDDLNTALECFNVKAISRRAVVIEMDRRVWGTTRQLQKK